MLKFSTLRTTGVLLLLATGQAQADMQTLRDSDRSIWLAAGAGLLNYKENVPAPNLPDSDYGYIPSVAAGVNYLSDSNLYAALEGSYNFGDVHYKGAPLATPTVPLEGSTRERIGMADAQLGWAFAVDSHALLLPYAELGFRSWYRDLTKGQREDFQNLDVLGGLKLQVSPLDRVVVSFYGAAGSTFDAQMNFQGATYNLGNAFMYKAGSRIAYEITKKFEVFTTVDYDHFRYLQSSVVSGAYEPTSFTNDAAIRIGLAYHF